MSEISIQSDFVDVPGGKVFTRLWTPASLRAVSTLVLLHDSLGSVALWRNFPSALAGRLGRPVLAYDRLGFGQSSARDGSPSIDFIREEASLFLPAVLNSLGITRCSLFGHSVGGAMALLAAALQANEVILSVVTESAQAFVEQRTLAGIRKAQQQFKRTAYFNRLKKWHGTKAQWVLDAWTGVWLAPSFSSWSLNPYLGSIHCPVMAIHGDMDEYGSTAFPNRIASGVGGPARVEILEGCGHLPHREQQEKVLELVADFLT